jgi:HPt (histidine-containing phosphotransfer) domain-containing protein
MAQYSLPPKAVFDVQGTLSRLGGDEELLADMIGFFVEDAPPLITELQSAIETQDAPAVKKAAHALKGLVLGCGGVRAGHAVQRVEDAAAAGEIDALVPLVADLTTEIDELVAATLPYRT